MVSTVSLGLGALEGILTSYHGQHELLSSLDFMLPTWQKLPSMQWGCH